MMAYAHVGYPVLMAMLIEILKEVRRLKLELRAKEEDLDVREKSD